VGIWRSPRLKYARLRSQFLISRSWFLTRRVFVAVLSLFGIAALWLIAGMQQTVLSENARSDTSQLRQVAVQYSQTGLDRQAVVALEQAFRLQPDSLLIAAELAMAYEQVERYSEARRMWLRTGTRLDNAEIYADEELAQKQYEAAWQWYRRVKWYETPASDGLPFKTWLAALLSGDELPLGAAAGGVPLTLYVVDDDLTIPARDLRWISTQQNVERIWPGLPLNVYSSQPDVGVFWWNGTAVTIVEVVTPGTYEVQLHVRNSVPAPVHMLLEIDGQQYALSPDRGDNSWVTYAASFELEAGRHMVQVSYLNNAIIDGEDRDAAMRWIRLRRLP
jgi:tetratricopeptide (TPR) repeat protein